EHEAGQGDGGGEPGGRDEAGDGRHRLPRPGAAGDRRLL
ncbi:MAG: hypothetical protein AVDCRST_MAG19-266, partial [uncultured Thermomicrobiales bacterium]